MSESLNTSRYDNYGRLGIGSVATAVVFFVIYSQFVIFRVPPIVTQFFRPILIALLLIQMIQRGATRPGPGVWAFVAAGYCTVVILFNDIDSVAVMNGGAVVLYFLMFVLAIASSWNRREIRLIIFACFIGAFVCTVVLFMFNPITDLHRGTEGDFAFMGYAVNRNKNTYAFSVGVIIGTLYLLNGKRVPKLLILLMTAFMAYGVAYSQCRGSFFCLIAAELVIFGGRIHSIQKKDAGKALIYTLLLIAFCLLGYFLLKNSELSRLVDGESTSGRYDGIKKSWVMFLNSDFFTKLFGSGFAGAFQNQEEVGAHLVYATFLISTGLIGAVVVLLMFLSSFRMVRGSVPLAFLVFAFLRTFFEGLDYYIYIPLIISVIIFIYTKRTGQEGGTLFE